MSLCLSAHWILSSNGKKSDNLHLLSKLCNSAQFWPFHRKVRNDEKNARKNSNARDGDMWDIQAPYCSGIGLKLRLDTRKMDICNIPPYCSTREINLIKDHPLQRNIQTRCRDISKHLENIEILKIPSQVDFWLGDLRHVQLN